MSATRAISVGRALPFVRSFTSVAAGSAGVPPPRFGVVSLIGTASNAAATSTLGYVVGWGYPHFQFSDYSKLTVIGVLIASAAWPVTTRITSAPRWMFFRMAILVTLVLWLPDLYILHGGSPDMAVAVLMVMHLAIALVTYNALVRLAPLGREVRSRTR